MIRIIKGLAALATGFMVAACGSGGADAGSAPFGGGSGPGTTPSAATIEVVSSASQLGTSAPAIQITAIVRDASNVTIPSASVSFSANTGSLSGVPATTDAAGVARANFTAGADKSNRSATVTVRSGTVSGFVTVAIDGTSLSYSGPSTLQFNGTAALSVKLTDSLGAGIAGQVVAVSSSLGATLSAPSVTTDNLGNASVTYTANRAGTDTIQFAALGVTRSADINISGEDFSIIAPAPASTIAIGASQTVTARYLINGAPAAGAFRVRFATTAGTILPALAMSPGLDLAAGQASITVSSTFAGPATIQATLVNTTTSAVLAQAILPVQFVATTPSAIVIQMTPSAIGPNAAGATTSQALVRATVTDPGANPVQGAIVNFSKDADPSGGNLSQASAVTDANGNATVQFIAGATPTAADAVVLRATVAGTAVTDTQTMTVNQSALFIALGTGNQISNVNETAYQKVWTAYVTDASGAAVPNQTLTVSVLPNRYAKGSYAWFGDPVNAWSRYLDPWSGTPSLRTDGTLPAGAYVVCQNEDTDFSGVVSVAKDLNGNGRLEPGNVISVNGGLGKVIVTTDDKGFALLNLVYAESYVSWVEVDLKVSATVAGTESSNQARFWVQGLASDFTVETVPPAGLYSPFGQMPSCANPN